MRFRLLPILIVVFLSLVWSLIVDLIQPIGTDFHTAFLLVGCGFIGFKASDFADWLEGQ